MSRLRDSAEYTSKPKHRRVGDILRRRECWTTTKALERVLHTMEMRMLRWTIGVTLKEKVSNDTVRSIFGVVPITEKMKEARLGWFGHVLRREEDSVAKTAQKLDVPGVRPRERPKIR
ncbi:hypothetical protein RB195_013258 [Necator americanus]|uniref:Reverse transcriptase domain-containing protein n=1 Tax=Necator americanus TaxID=51031 RepID=A0ABR1DUQ8_NECAM